MRRPSPALLLLAALGCGSSSASPPASEGVPGPDGVPAVTPPAVTAPVAAAPSRPAGPADDACSNAALELPAGTVIATVDGEPIRAEALGAESREAEREALHTYCREVHRIRQITTRNAIDDHLLARAARKDGIDVDQLVRKHLDANVQRPDASEVDAYYAANKTEQAPPLELVRGQVEEAMVKERSQAAYDGLLADLHKAAKVESKLPDIRPPAYDLAPPDHAATFGPADAKVQIVEFSDFECPYCSRAATTVAAVKQRFGDQVQFSYRHFPLSFHPAARPAAELSQCALEQGKFWEVHDEIFEHQSELSAESLRGMAQNAGLDMSKLDECLASGRARQQVDQDLAKGQEVGVRGTPSFYIDGRPYDGDLGPDALGAAIQDALGAS
ncbi:DsbA family protein [Paraliomyxa miuraensis]|uniref:DsbA family protein n=1 Tax=Paraliomyxa miuraensis TaxID=376150 RepID=UPI0022510BEB|nr:DsbA family protein [Paraliomyxa miuraensis]MCX4241681.1 DsbA family protein [Paraliomyxa miuraensis]